MALTNLYRSALLQLRIWYHEIALTQIEPHHEDVPYIVLKLAYLTEELKGPQ